jgi:uncharacterized protein YhbP (UPF0306 family)
VATVAPDHSAWANVAFFCVAGDWDFLIWSNPETTHASNAAANPAAALTITDSSIEFGGVLSGLQATGTLTQVKGLAAAKAFAAYVARFSSMLKQIPSYGDMESAAAARFYLFKTTKLKVLDEPAHGSYGYVEAVISGD